MRATVDAKAFVQALDRVSGIIRKSSIPVLNAVLVRFGDGHCTLTATNIETYLSAALPAQGDAFAFLLDRPRETARAFRQFEGELTLEQTEKGEGDRRRITLALSCGPRAAELHPFLPEDFPRGPKWEPQEEFTANAARLYARVERVKYAAGLPEKNDARPCRSKVQFSGARWRSPCTTWRSLPGSGRTYSSSPTAGAAMTGFPCPRRSGRGWRCPS